MVTRCRTMGKVNPLNPARCNSEGFQRHGEHATYGDYQAPKHFACCTGPHIYWGLMEQDADSWRNVNENQEHAAPYKTGRMGRNYPLLSPQMTPC